MMIHTLSRNGICSTISESLIALAKRSEMLVSFVTQCRCTLRRVGPQTRNNRRYWNGTRTYQDAPTARISTTPIEVLSFDRATRMAARSSSRSASSTRQLDGTRSSEPPAIRGRDVPPRCSSVALRLLFLCLDFDRFQLALLVPLQGRTLSGYGPSMHDTDRADAPRPSSAERNEPARRRNNNNPPTSGESVAKAASHDVRVLVRLRARRSPASLLMIAPVIGVRCVLGRPPRVIESPTPGAARGVRGCRTSAG